MQQMAKGVGVGWTAPERGQVMPEHPAAVDVPVQPQVNPL